MEIHLKNSYIVLKYRILYGLLMIIMILISEFSFKGIAQDMNEVKQTIATLCSREFAGRGYSHQGDSLTANYIAGFFKKLKLKNFNNSYFQPFPISVNTFPGKMKLALNDSILIPGYDFIVSPASCSCEGEFPVIVMDKNLIDFPDNFRKISEDSIKKSFLLIDTLGVKNKGFKDAIGDISNSNMFGAKGLIEIQKGSLTHHLSNSVSAFPKIIVSRNSLIDSIRKIIIHIESKFLKEYKTNNVIGFIPGKIDSFIVFSAHYDHLGKMGDEVYFPGANDNASGVAMLFELARYFSKEKKNLKYGMLFLFFSGEELGMLGSEYFSENPLFPLGKIKFLINLEMLGNGEAGIDVVNGTIYEEEFNTLLTVNQSGNYLSDIGIRGPSTNSDHYPFQKKGVKSFFIYTLGDYSGYHSIFDDVKSLPLSKFKGLFNLLVGFANAL